jgi:hypothetical protein
VDALPKFVSQKRKSRPSPPVNIAIAIGPNPSGLNAVVWRGSVSGIREKFCSFLKSTSKEVFLFFENRDNLCKMEIPQEKLIEWAIENLRKFYIKVAPSKLHGVGLFALRNIPKDTVILTFSYANFHCVEIKKSLLKQKIPKEVYSQLIKNWSETENSVYLPLNINEQLHYVNFLNHSENPNIRFENGKYITQRNIIKGEELLVNFKDNYNPHGVRY